MKTRKYLAVIEQDRASGWYIGSIPSLPGAHTQAKTLDELDKNLQEVIGIILEDHPELKSNRDPEPIGTHLVEVRI